MSESCYLGYLFDLDGTLVDSAPDIAAAANHVLQEFGHEPLDVPLLGQWVGHGAGKLLERAFLLAGDEYAPPGYPDGAHDAFISFYSKYIAVYSKPYPRVMTTLAELSDRGAALGVVTNKDRHLAESLLESLDVRKYLSTVVGGKCAARPKPSAAPVVLACTGLAVAPERVLMVGDTYVDQLAARAAGADYVQVDYGYRLAPDGDAPEPPRFISSLADLLDMHPKVATISPS